MLLTILLVKLCVTLPKLIILFLLNPVMLVGMVQNGLLILGTTTKKQEWNAILIMFLVKWKRT